MYYRCTFHFNFRKGHIDSKKILEFESKSLHTKSRRFLLIINKEKVQAMWTRNVDSKMNATEQWFFSILVKNNVIFKQ